MWCHSLPSIQFSSLYMYSEKTSTWKCNIPMCPVSQCAPCPNVSHVSICPVSQCAPCLNMPRVPMCPMSQYAPCPNELPSPLHLVKSPSFAHIWLLRQRFASSTEQKRDVSNFELLFYVKLTLYFRNCLNIEIIITLKVLIEYTN